MQHKNHAKDTKATNNDKHEPLKRLNKRKKVFIVVFSLSFAIFGLVFQLLTMELTTYVNPEAVDWIPLETTNKSFKNFPWVEIVETKYAVMNRDLYFLVKWNGIAPDSFSSNDLTKPHYLIRRKAYISWTINQDNYNTSTKGVLYFSEGFVLFQFIEGATAFQYATHSIPFANETSVAFKIIYKKGAIPIESLSQVGIVPAGDYTAYKSYHSVLQSLSDLPESPPSSFKIDGDLSDWLNSDVNSIQMSGSNNGLSDTLLFPFYENILVTRTLDGIYGAVTLSNNFTQFINTIGNLNINIYWTTVLAVINGSYAADYAFETYLSFNCTTGYLVENVSIALIAGYDYPSIFEDWQLQDNQSGTKACFECFFPIDIISPLFGNADNIYFYSSMDIEWF
jgi:hypothetical protein